VYETEVISMEFPPTHTSHYLFLQSRVFLVYFIDKETYPRETKMLFSWYLLFVYFCFKM